MKNLISMIDFVIQQWDKDIYTDDFAQLMIIYANFLKQPLELWMFVPCNEDGNVLEEPEFSEPNNESEIGNYDELRYQYQQAKERCLFLSQHRGEDFDSALASVYLDEFFNVEQLSNNIRLIQLTETAIKKIGL